MFNVKKYPELSSEFRAETMIFHRHNFKNIDCIIY